MTLGLTNDSKLEAENQIKHTHIFKMRSILQSAVLLTAFSLSRTSAQSDTFDATTNTGGQDPKNIAGGLALRTPTDLGCFSSPGKLFDMGVYTYQTPGWCQPLCVRLARNYFGLVNGTNCFCGDSPPSNEFKVESLNCDQKCSGFDKARCKF